MLNAAWDLVDTPVGALITVVEGDGQVVGADGSLVGYGGGLAAKAALLRLEGARLASLGQLPLDLV